MATRGFPLFVEDVGIGFPHSPQLTVVSRAPNLSGRTHGVAVLTTLAPMCLIDHARELCAEGVSPAQDQRRVEAEPVADYADRDGADRVEINAVAEERAERGGGD